MQSPSRNQTRKHVLTTPNQPIRKKLVCTDIIKERKRKKPRRSIEIPFFANENQNFQTFTELFPQQDGPVNIQNLQGLSYTGTLFDIAIQNEVPKEMEFTDAGCGLCLESHGTGYVYCTRENCKNITHEMCMIQWRSQCQLANTTFSCPFCRCKELKL